MDDLGTYKNSRCIDLATEDHINDYEIWSRRGTASECSELSSDTRYFGHPKEFVHGSHYLYINTEADLSSLCAQHLYSAFISNLVENIADVGGETELCVTDSSTGLNSISESQYEEWRRLRPKNTNIDSLATSYHESNLGTIEEAYCTIIPALRNSGLLPDVVRKVRKSARKLEREARWIPSIRFDQWIYSGLRPGCPDNSELKVGIENRRVRLTSWLKNRATASPESAALWDAAYLAC